MLNVAFGQQDPLLRNRARNCQAEYQSNLPRANILQRGKNLVVKLGV